MIQAARKTTADYLYVDDEQNIEFTCELEFDAQPAEPEVGIMTGSIDVTGVLSVEGVAYIGKHGARLEPSKESPGWEDDVKRRVMHLYKNSPATRDAMDTACCEALAAESADDAELRAEAEAERVRNRLFD